MIQASSLNITSFIWNCDSTQAESARTVNQPKEAFFFSLNISKSFGCDGSSFNVVRICFGPLLKPLMAGELKIARVTSIFKSDDVNELGNYWPI